VTAQGTEREAVLSVPQERPPFWRDIRVLRVAIQVVFAAAVLALLWYLVNNLIGNMRAHGMRTDFGFLERPAGFRLGAGTEFNARDSILQAMLTGLRNTIYVSAWGIILASIVGLVVGVARLSANWLVRKSAAVYVETLRNIPPIVFLFFMYFAVLTQLPRIGDAVHPLGVFVLSNRGLHVPWFDVTGDPGAFLIGAGAAAVVAIAVGWWRTRRFEATGTPHHRILFGAAILLAGAVIAWLTTGRPLALSLPLLEERVVDGGLELSVEYGALLVGLTLYMSAFLAEVIRGSILSVNRGQVEAADALGLSGFQRLRHVILPQALRVAVPPTGNEYINLAKNSALGIAIAFPELLRVTRIAIGQGNPAPQLIGIMMAFYLALSLVLSALVNLYNRRLRRRGGG
jgi:general L-amino acid transport system permease protein